MQTIGERLRQLRETTGKSAWQVSIETGIQVTNIYNWESGKSRPRSQNDVAKLADFYNTTTDYLITGLEPASVAR